MSEKPTPDPSLKKPTPSPFIVLRNSMSFSLRFSTHEWKLWSGKYDANGGYLVVKKDGEILCYHFYDQNRFEDFLFKNAYLERGKTRRHGYASLYRDEDSNVYFKLNLQIRLK